MEFIVYKVTFPNNKVYIGITSKALDVRKKQHYREAKRNRYNYKFYNALLKYKEQEIWEIVDSTATSWEELKQLEKQCIQKYDSFNSGYNLSLGGDGTLGHKHSEKSKQKMRGPRPQTSLALKGKTKSAEHKRKLSEFRKAFRYTREQKEQQSLNCGGKKFLVFKNDKIIAAYISKKVCSKELNLHPRGIQGCLNQPEKFKSHKGFTFKYLEEPEHVEV